MKKNALLLIGLLCITPLFSQSVARHWNEEVLHAIRNDFARPTVHARNLFHTSAAMYDAWAVFDTEAAPYFLGNTIEGFTFKFNGFTPSEAVSNSRDKAISYAVYRLIEHRFVNSPGTEDIMTSTQHLMDSLGYDISIRTEDYTSGDGAALGNYIAAKIIEYGLQDGSNEANDYANRFYEPVNETLNMDISGNATLTHPNRWQPLKLSNYVDQSGNSIPGGEPEFLSPEWGAVIPFSLQEEDKTTYTRDGFDYNCYYDPGPPAYIQDGMALADPYKWNFSLVAVWGAHLDPNEETSIDISPRVIGNLDSELFPETFDEYTQFYDYFEGGDPSTGRTTNPTTGEAYEPQIVKRGDYARVLAEFWADGPDSETPPGHWFTILNYVNDNPLLEKKFEGQGETLSNLEWDVKSYFILGGAMHDVAITAWGLKGYYDYIRPVSAIRYMSEKGQSKDTTLPRYHPHGIPLIPGYIELVEEGDPLAGSFNENLHKIKLYTWKGPSNIIDPLYDIAGVGWILAEEWFPYQRPSFVTPPFAGYVSGHSTYSRTAAEILTQLTGDEFFPGGMGVFDIPANDFLVFERGPSEDMQLQWATYRDASDQCSLSRIWGGIHPPIDDIPGRKIGEALGSNTFSFAKKYFTKRIAEEGVLYPNPAEDKVTIGYATQDENTTVRVMDVRGRELFAQQADFSGSFNVEIDISTLGSGIYFVQLVSSNKVRLFTKKILKQ
ncbi:T9SS type A sorting domain-containing protein [Marinirhabdus gelatinilytica]|uniref:Putative secreted protein (Por secretion system target) n=1 Tax=Marinirhabdus gelatinilytica TaxID=1703343 RepID=A0A370Q8M4_9FLAO|nr:T9SS type A sorting domain-containing protein [Marinirhabdus gelatinilytica]RDK84659.1 putative secreted protein (Por secretion system target) [Marinirhabdus gelatinilytica]